MRVLPPAEREAMYAIYAFCREVDDIADDQAGERADRAVALDQWRADIADLYDGGSGGKAAYLSEAVRRFGCLQVDFNAVIDGMAMDVARDIRWPQHRELDLYCDRVASAVGRLSVRVFGMEEQPGLALSHHLGRALQLTNILRDIDEDAAIGRVYLPREAIETAGIRVGDIAKVIDDPRIDQVAQGLAAEARVHFAQAQAILDRRPRGHLIAPRLMAGAYAMLLRRMVAKGWTPPRSRVGHNKLRLAWLLLRLKLSR
ncbi:presqualene diphosphate synthase HpnD [Sphingomonas nostoxanthinifaciens]|uniref:presqualene diphosphate synthase HpnD n=1 Tax=Sphingomonas nostoxanthinifaciens TaxID=2872652 RepID=UPI0021D930EF|nr:presqualene diphosphate synthase HpnD [Sphingomonas nostoxanthinifaciens]UAK26691.1 presqualene diphosphate synthase HpnD [Sphingomonas nostoxanthinifaciens]